MKYASVCDGIGAAHAAWQPLGWQCMWTSEIEPFPSACSNGGTMIVNTAVRRLTPRECERLQGFPDDYTAITYRKKPAADGPRYKALGNSMAVPCMRWIGERIEVADRECVPK